MPPRAATLPLLLLTGAWSELEDLARQTRSNGSPLERPMAVMVLSQLLRHRGERDEAWQLVGEILPRGPASEPEDALFPYAMEMIRLATRLALDADDLRTASEWLQAHNRWLEWSDACRGRAESLSLHADLLRRRGRHREAETLAAEAVSVATEPWQPVAVIEAERVLARILAETGKLDAAEAHLNRAIELAQLCELPFEQACARADITELVYQHRSNGASLDQHLETAQRAAEELNAQPLLKQIETIRNTQQKNGHVSILSPREIEVLSAVANGMTDADAAAALSISPRTVSQHMRSVYNKLGVSSRAAATRWAVLNRLV
jgi:ATP/maltotriose-dependent transcriptional regulator MalT